MQFSRPPAIEIEQPSFAERRERYFAAKGNGFDVKAADKDFEINLYDEIGLAGISAKAFKAKLAEAGQRDITLRINSPGGDVFQGLGIFSDLIAHPGAIRVEIVGIAASIASIIAMAGDERFIADSSFLMVHNSWTLALGNETEFLEIAALLRKIDDSMARTYAARTKIDPRVIKQMLNDETWMTGKEAVANGFATGLLPASDVSARFDLSIFAKAPGTLRDAAVGTIKPNDISNVREYERFLRDSGFSKSRATALAASGFRSAADQSDSDAAYSELAQHIAAQAKTISHIH